MTDSSANPRNYGEPPLHEDDPLMELSRIMDFGASHDDNAWASRNERSRAESDFDAALDLERELMGAFDDEEPQQAAHAAFEQAPQADYPEAEPLIHDDELAFALDEELEPDLTEIADAPEMSRFEAEHSEPAAQFDHAGDATHGDAYDRAAHDFVPHDRRDEGYDSIDYQPAIEPQAHAYPAQPETAWDMQPAEPAAPQAAEPVRQPLSLEDELESLLFSDGGRSHAQADAAAESQAGHMEFAPQAHDDTVSYRQPEQPAEPDFDDFRMDDLSIDDGQPEAAAPETPQQPAAAAWEAPQQPAAAWETQPSAGPSGYPYYTRGNFASGVAAPVLAQPVADAPAAPEKSDFNFDDFSFDADETVAESTDDDLSGLDDLTLNEDDFGFEQSGDFAGAQLAQPQDDIQFSEDDFFAEDDFVANEASEETVYAHAVRADENHAAPAASAAPIFSAPAPEVETLSVAESKVEQTHSLDLPDVSYGEEEPASGLSELEAEFAEVFNTVEIDESGSESDAQSEADKAFEDIFRESASSYLPSAATGAALGAATAAAATAAYGRTQAPAQAGSRSAAGPVGPVGNEDDFYNHWAAPGAQTMEGGEFGARAAAQPDDDLGHAAEAYRNRPVRGRRGLILASVAGAAVLLGGIGYHLLGGGGSGEPVVIRADSQPTKMQPENPGGVTVPNQDKAVYDRVAGTLPNSPEQKALISSGEEPVDISGTDDNENMADDAPEPADTNPVQANGGQQPNTGQQANANANAPLIQPREVETMIVRPDGTFAQAEQPAQTPPPAAAPEPQPSAPSAGDPIAAIAAGENLPASTATPQAPAAQAPVAAETPRLPVRAPVVPSRPAEQPVNIVGNVPQRTQTPAAAPAQQVASAAGAGGYFIQIASQPSAELAQKSYANMAQRYANVIGGRGVDIKRADIPNKGTYYRVRVQAGSREDANALCGRLKSAGGSCLVTR